MLEDKIKGKEKKPLFEDSGQRHTPFTQDKLHEINDSLEKDITSRRNKSYSSKKSAIRELLKYRPKFKEADVSKIFENKEELGVHLLYKNKKTGKLSSPPPAPSASEIWKEKKPKKKKISTGVPSRAARLATYSFMAILIVGFFAFFYAIPQSSITGHAIFAEEYSAYEDDIGFDIEGTTTQYNWTINSSKGFYLRGLAVSGRIKGGGDARMLLTDGEHTYLVMDSTRLGDDRMMRITGHVVDIGGMNIANDTIETINDTLANWEGENNLTIEVNTTIENETNGTTEELEEENVTEEIEAAIEIEENNTVEWNVTIEEDEIIVNDTELTIEGNLTDDIQIVLEYNEGTLWDEDDDGEAEINDVVDLTVYNTVFQKNLYVDGLCTKWQITDITEGTAKVQCYGSDICCNFVGVDPRVDAWNAPFFVMPTEGYNLNVTAQVIYIDYSLDIDNLYKETYYSEAVSLPVTFVQVDNRSVIEFANVSDMTALITDFLDARTYTLIFEVDEGTKLEIDTITYALEEFNVTEAVNVTGNLTNVTSEKVKEDFRYDAIIDSSAYNNETDTLEVIFHHDAPWALPLSVKGRVKYELEKNISAGGENVTLTVYNWSNTRFRVVVGSHTEAFEFGEPEELVFNATITDAAGEEVDATIELIDSLTDEVSYSKISGDDEIIEEGEYNIKIDFENSPVQEIMIDDVGVYDDLTELVDVDDVEETGNFSKYTEVYALDPTKMNFTTGTVKATAKGRLLYKCKDWNFTTQTCPSAERTCTGTTKDDTVCTVYGGWEKVMAITPGDNYTFTITPADPAYAEYNSTYGAPHCTISDSPCIADSADLMSVNSIGTPEPNQPNTIDTCTDGGSGTYLTDENVENITITSLNGSVFSAGDTIQVDAWVYCYDSSSDNVNIVYTSNAGTPSWTVKAFTDPCPSVGFNKITKTFELDNVEGDHAIRAVIQYNGNTATTCGAGSYDDNDDVVFTVEPPTSGMVQSRVSQSSDDAEEHLDGTMEVLTSTDLELVLESDNQLVGMRFQNIGVPSGATINNAYIEFEIDEYETQTTNLNIYGQDADNSGTFSITAYDISGRTKTSASTAWNSVAAPAVDAKLQSPDISSVIQEVVDRGGWSSGNAMVIMINGTGKRTVESWDGESTNAPLLVVNWSVTNTPPTTPTSILCDGGNCDNTFVDDIEVNCSGSTDAENDTLTYVIDAYYDSQSTSTFTDGFESGALSADWATYESNTYGRTQVTTSYSPHSGSYHVAMDSTTGGNYVVNCMYTTFDMSGASNINLSYWIDESGDEDNECPVSGTMSAMRDCTAYTCDGSTWYRLTDLAPAPGSYTQYTENDIDTSCGEITSDFSIAFCQYDNYPFTDDGFTYDDISIEYYGDVSSWQTLGNHSEGSAYTWNTSGVTPQSDIDLRCRAIDLTGSNDYSSYYDPSINLTITDDATPPASVTGLAMQSHGTTWIYWNWTNPVDADFSQAMVYIDGISAVNTSNNYYNATSLTINTNYTITVHTKDTSNNVNDTDVNNTAWTNRVPTHTTPVLSSSSSTNTTNENLTCYNQTTIDPDSDAVKNIFNWYKNSTSITVLNMPFEGGSNSTDTTDHSGNSNDGAVTNATWNSTGGYDGKGAYEFGGNTTYIEISADSSLDLSNSCEFTQIAWIYPTHLDAGYHGFLGHQNGGNTNRAPSLWIYDYTEIHAGFGNSTDWLSFITTTDPITNNDWNHVAVRFNGTHYTVIVNGVTAYDSTGVWTGECPLSSANSVDIGRVDNYFDGVIDDVIIFNISLSDEQIIAIYNNRTDLIVSQETTDNETWQCAVTPNDGYQDGTTLQSNSLTISDTTAPASITGLSMQSRGETWIYWTWTNPGDADFNETIIYIDGSNVFNTSNNYYNATAFSEYTQHTITVHTKDNDGNVNDADVNSTATTLDVTNPSVINVQPTAGTDYNQSQTVLITANVTDTPSGVSTVKANITTPEGGWQLWDMTGTEIYGLNFTSTSQVGTYNVTIIATDASGNVNNTETTWFTVSDIGLPIINNVLPTAGTAYDWVTSVNVEANVTDSEGISKVLLNISYPNGSTEQVEMTNVSSNYTSIITSINTFGRYNLTIIANDTSNNIATVDTYYTIEDSTLPTIVDVVCTPSVIGINDTTTCNATVTDNFALDTVKANVTQPNTTVIWPAISNVSTTYQFTFSSTADFGTYTVGWYANDTEGNIQTQSTTFKVTQPAINPLGCIPSPANISDTIVCRVNVTTSFPAIPVDTVLANVTMPNTTIKVQTVNFESGDIYNFTFTQSTIYGIYNVTWWANDTSDTSSTSSDSFEVIDTTPPASVTSLANQSAGTSWIYWNWTNPVDSDFNRTIIYIGGVWQVNLSAGINYYNATGLSSGTSYTITAHTIDNSGNVNNTDVNDTTSTVFVSVVGFTITLPGQAPVMANATGNATGTMLFNSSSNTYYDMDPCVQGTSECQDSKVPFFTYLNTGNVNLNMSISLDTALPSLFNLTVNTLYNATSSNVVSTTPLTIGSGISPGGNLSAFFFGDFMNAYPTDSLTRNLVSNGTQS